MNVVSNERVCVAPMMDWTDRHCRYLHRQLTRHALLYTEMVTTDAILRGDRGKLLRYHPDEHPVALQLGGADPDALAECARIGADYGYDEINLNVGCPSDRVQSGRFGACLMREPAHVADCVAAMVRAVGIPITVKSRIAVDEQAEWPTLSDFANRIHAAGAARHIVHARKALLAGLSPKENREIPPLRYDIVYRLKEAAPDRTVILNGGVQSYSEIDAHLTQVDGVMLGRCAYQNPYILAEVDERYFGAAPRQRSRGEIARSMTAYIEGEMISGVPLRAVTRHMIGLFQGVPGARAWRRYLSENVHRDGATAAVVEAALACIPREIAAAAE